MMKKHLIFLFSLGLFMYHPCSAQKIIYKDKDVTVTDNTPSVTGEISAAIEREMAIARKDDVGEAPDSAGIGVRFKEAFPYLSKYLNDPSDNVKSEIIFILTWEQSARSLKLTTRFINQNSIASPEGCRNIYALYTKSQIIQWGGKALREGTFKTAGQYTQPATIFLLSCFGPTSRANLKSLRQRYKKETFVWDEPAYSQKVPATFACDIALAQTGDAVALKRAKDELDEGDLELIGFLLDSSKFLDTKPLLQIMLDALKDKRPLRIYPSYSSKTPIYSRVCDLAWAALQFKLGKTEQIEHQPEPQKDAVLQLTAQAVKRKFSL